MEPPFPPFDPDGSASKSDDEKGAVQATRLRDIPLRKIFPNLLTLFAICSGLTSIRFAIEGRMEFAIAAIILAAFLDGIDGRVARFLKSTSRFGAEMDSLADFVNFGVAPAMILYFTQLSEIHSIGWIAALLYAICACLRLARFNVMLDTPNAPKWQNKYFTGVPAPAAAMIVLIPIYAALLGMELTQITAWIVAAYTVGIGLLMVSNLPTFSGKDFTKSIRRDLVLPLMILAVALAGMLFTYPWWTLLAISIGYLALIPFSLASWQKDNAGETSAKAQK
ncbi:MAG: CDP-diacylglycerol--serine O-phosphatidyltransferase [Hyphomicrobiales bacterium]|nr:MAG: CDP-diacylglycerol--serine O-phosphatidyltransferase [Hyphomicrobiales bacterium]